MDPGGPRKRGADRQITKDDDPYDEGEEGAAGGSFQRADETVLATRRILKARRPPPSGSAGPAGRPPSGGARPPHVSATSQPGGSLFSGFSLVGAPKAGPKAPAAVGDSDGGAGGGGDDLGGAGKEEEIDPRGRPVPPPPDPEDEEGPPRAAEAGVMEAEESDSDDVTSVPRKPAPGDVEVASKETSKETSKGVPWEDKKGEVEKQVVDGEKQGNAKESIGDGPKKGPSEGEGATSGKEAEAEAEAEAETEAGAEAEAASGEKKAAGPFGAFAKLSSTTNAFASPFGAPFPSSAATSSPFSFGVIPSAFGSNTVTPSVSPLAGPAAAGAPSTLPSLSSVFGESNGARVQLFGASIATGEGSSGSLPGGATGAAPAAVVTLPAVDIVTGEEEEKALFAGEASLFEFVEGGKWKERGKGEVRLNAPDSDSRPARLVMRAKGNLRLLLNANLFPEMKVTKMDGRGLSFACVNSVEDMEKPAENAATLTTLALRFKDPALTTELIDLIEVQKLHKPAPPVVGSKDENGSAKPAVQDDLEAGAPGDASAKDASAKDALGKDDPESKEVAEGEVAES